MPPDRMISRRESTGPEAMRAASSSARPTETQVLAVLAGARPEDVTAGTPTSATDLAEAVSAYRAAGRTALEVRNHDWYQVRIQFPDWQTAESVAADQLWPELHRMREDGVLSGWWYVRKYPFWRLRSIANRNADRGHVITMLTALLERLASRGLIDGWQQSIYEPEVLTFGGPYGIDLAHHLFHADSDGFLGHLHHSSLSPRPARREHSLLLCGTLIRAARQDAPEQADIWHRVAHLRPLPAEPPADRLQGMAPAVRRLLTADTDSTSQLFTTGGILAHAAAWFAAFTEAGHQLADAARDGTLERGLRATLASHIIFHWNRLGLPARTQAVLARAVRNALLDPDDNLVMEPPDAPNTR